MRRLLPPRPSRPRPAFPFFGAIAVEVGERARLETRNGRIIEVGGDARLFVRTTDGDRYVFKPPFYTTLEPGVVSIRSSNHQPQVFRSSEITVLEIRSCAFVESVILRGCIATGVTAAVVVVVLLLGL